MICATCQLPDATFVTSKPGQPMTAICYLCMIFQLADRILSARHRDAVRTVLETKTRRRRRKRKDHDDRHRG